MAIFNVGTVGSLKGQGQLKLFPATAPALLHNLGTCKRNVVIVSTAPAATAAGTCIALREALPGQGYQLSPVRLLRRAKVCMATGAVPVAVGVVPGAIMQLSLPILYLDLSGFI